MKKTLLLIAFVMTAVGGWAQGVSVNDALAKAKAFMSERQAVDGAQNSRLMGNKLFQRVNSNSEYYIFNVGTGDGFVIVSGDERTDDILGFCDKGAIDMDNMPENMRWWLDMYREEIAQLQQSASTPLRAAIPSLPAISPMLTTNWDQDNPYNSYTPEYAAGKKSVTGCVATAMSQILYNIRPDITVGAIPEYTTKRGIQLDALDPWTPDWAAIDNGNMNEVARLMRYVGQSVLMNYYSSSGAVSEYLPLALRHFFSIDCHMYNRVAYSNNDWITMLHSELSKNTPVFLSGQSETSGHAFVCDGYDGNGLFHINWGWSGSSNGYFKMDNLTPKTQGTGGSSGGYSMNVDAIVGFKKTEDNNPNYNLLICRDLEANSTVNYNTSVQIFLRLANYSPHTNNTYDYGFGLFDQNDNLIEVKSAGTGSWNVGQGYSMTRFPKFTQITPGNKYKIYAVCSISGTDDWHKCAVFNNPYIDVDAKEDKIYFSSPNAFSNKTACYTVDAVEVVGDVYAISSYKNKMNITVTNNGTTNECKFLVVENNTITSLFSVLLDPGETATIPVDFTCYQAGEHEISIYQEHNSEQIYLESFKVNAKLGSFTSLTFTSRSKCENENDGELKATAVIKNSSSTVYTAPIKITLYKVADDNMGHSMSKHTDIYTINKGETKTINHTFTGLSEGKYFIVVAYYPNETTEDSSQGNCKSYSIPVKATPTAIESVKTDASTPLRIYTIDGRRVNPDSMKKGIYIINGKKVAM